MTASATSRILLSGALWGMVPAEVGCTHRNTGSWNLPPLPQVGRIQWVDEDGPVRCFYYGGEPYRDRATRVFAYYAAPPEPTGKLPGMVLVHGCGGTAFKEWAELWAERGYAGIGMDLAGRGPDGERLAGRIMVELTSSKRSLKRHRIPGVITRWRTLLRSLGAGQFA